MNYEYSILSSLLTANLSTMVRAEGKMQLSVRVWKPNTEAKIQECGRQIVQKRTVAREVYGVEVTVELL